MAQGICEGLWIHMVIQELKVKFELLLKLYFDSKTTTNTFHNLVQHDWIHHIEIDHHFIKEKLDAALICLPFVTSSQQTVDILAKSLAKRTFEHFVGKLDMIDIYAPTRGGCWSNSVVTVIVIFIFILFSIIIIFS